MSFDATVWAWRQAVANSNELITLLAMADIANEQDELYASHAYIAEKTHRSVRSVRSAIDALEEAGLLTKVPRPGWPDTIRLNIPDDFQIGKRWRDRGGEAGKRGRPAREKTPANPENLGNLGSKTPARDAKTPAPVADKPTLEPSGREPERANALPALPVDSRCDARKAFDAWNEFAKAHGKGTARLFTDGRRKSIDKRLKECGGLDAFLEVISKIPSSRFLMGFTRAQFVISLDFVLQASSFAKMADGFYHQERPEPYGSAPTSPGRGADRADRKAAYVSGALAAVDGRRGQ